MQHIEVNVQTGERTVREFTPDEVAAVQARIAAEAAKPVVKTMEERLAALEAKVL